MRGTLHPGLRHHRPVDIGAAIAAVAEVLAVAGVLAYNWWVAVPFVPGLLPSINGFFSDLEVAGRPHAALMSDCDVLAGTAMFAALVLRGSASRDGVRREWKWMLAFALAGVIGGRFQYACSEGLSATCRAMEWHLQLPLHHYIHVLAGITEFATLTTAAVIAMRRTRGDRTPEARMYAAIVWTLAVGYPLLGLAYLTDRLGVFVEPIFFVAFSVMFLTEIFEPAHPVPASPTWAERVTTRGLDEADQGRVASEGLPGRGA
jgi:Protein of unknown function (DUF998)